MIPANARSSAISNGRSAVAPRSVHEIGNAGAGLDVPQMDGTRPVGVHSLTYSCLMDMSRHMTDRTTVRLPEDLLKRAKRKAAAEGRTLTSLIADGLRLVIAENRKVTKPNRLMPRISKATGGSMPGLDLGDLPALQEMDDLDYVRRMKHFK